MMMEWIMKVHKAVLAITDDNIPPTQSGEKEGREGHDDGDRASLSVLKSDVLDNLDLLKRVYPLLSLVASWTQTLTA